MPQIFILTIDMTVHFLVILGRVSNAIVEAVELRTCGKKNPNWKKAPTGGILGTTYLISKECPESRQRPWWLEAFLVNIKL